MMGGDELELGRVVAYVIWAGNDEGTSSSAGPGTQQHNHTTNDIITYLDRDLHAPIVGHGLEASEPVAPISLLS